MVGRTHNPKTFNAKMMKTAKTAKKGIGHRASGIGQ